MNLRIYKILEKTKVEGPETRFCIWVQGCSRHCKGCGSPHTWDKEKGLLLDIEEIFERIKKNTDIEGVTFLGGEPFEQAQALSELAEKIKTLNLGIITFSGFTIEELQAKNNVYINKLIKNTDLLIDGAFEEDKFDLSRPWVGSSNQRYHFLTNRYNKEEILGIKNKVEVRFQKDGSVFINGMGDFEKIKKTLCSN